MVNGHTEKEKSMKTREEELKKEEDCQDSLESRKQRTERFKIVCKVRTEKASRVCQHKVHQ